MFFIKITLSIFILFMTSLHMAQVEIGILGHSNEINIDCFYANDTINLFQLRETTNFLTDANLIILEKDTIPKRKKAFVRHIKHLSEQLEFDYYNHIMRSKKQEEIISELLLFKASLEQKTRNKAHPKMSYGNKIKMVTNTITSRQRLKIKIPKDIQNYAPIVNSPYWHQPNQEKPIYKQFAYLAKQKKIKHQKKIVLLFKDLSLSGSAPKVNTYDIDLDNQWTLKWGDEIHTDVVGSRIFAALGYDIDHPYYYEREKLTLIFDDFSTVKNKNELIKYLLKIYKVNLAPFISNSGTVSDEMLLKNEALRPFKGKQFIQFVKCAIEARPDRVKRIGSFLPELNANRRELRAALLAHQFIGNWDTREENTLLTTVHNGHYKYRMSAIFSDLGTSLGTHSNYLPPDFKVGLVNKLPWEAVKRKGNKIIFTNKINAILPPYKEATYEDLLWMANRIALLDKKALTKIIKKAHWSAPISKLYFHKLASRRASILKAFDIVDSHPIEFDNKLTIVKEGILIIQRGKLVLDYNPDKNPESFYRRKGRLRNYGH